MRKLFLSGLFVALTGVSAIQAAESASGLTSSAESECQVIILTELTKEVMEDFFAGRAAHLILECTEGTILPFNLSFQGEILALDAENASYSVKVLKTCFIKCIDDTFLFSSDLHGWGDFQEFFTGMISVNLNVDQGNPSVGFSIQLNSRLSSES